MENTRTVKTITTRFGSNLSMTLFLCLGSCPHKMMIAMVCEDTNQGSRVNDHHKDKPRGAKRRGKRTVAKEKVYKHISRRIRQIKPHFNIGISTGTIELLDRFTDPYRHWLFVPNDHVYTGGSKKNTPTPSNNLLRNT